MTTPPDQLSEPFPWARPPVDPPELYRWLQGNDPVRRVITNAGEPVWLVTRYDDVRTILADPRVSADAHIPGFPHLGFPPPENHRTFLRMDPPEHTVFRRLLTKHFIVKRIEALRPRMQELVDTCLDDLLASTDRRGDLVRSFALPVPSTILAWILGVPDSDQRYFNEAAEALMSRSDPDNLAAAEGAVDVRVELHGYIGGLLDQRIAAEDPGPDILGDLAAATRDGRIDRTQAISTGVTLLIAGHETTANMSALGVATLLQHPDQLAQLREDPSLIPAAIEELLRYLTIVHLIVRRVASEDIEIAGRVIPAGEGIFPLNLAANRDDSHYDRADELDIHRAPRDHVAFGFGVHQCLGQPLARVELQVMLETLIRRIPTLELAAPAAELDYKSHAPINGLRGLPVAW